MTDQKEIPELWGRHRLKNVEGQNITKILLSAFPVVPTLLDESHHDNSSRHKPTDFYRTQFDD
jgi:hypothetical protein